MSTPEQIFQDDSFRAPALCAVCDDTLVPVATPCTTAPRGRPAALHVCATCGTRQALPRARRDDYFDVVMRVRRVHRHAPRRATAY